MCSKDNDTFRRGDTSNTRDSYTHDTSTSPDGPSRSNKSPLEAQLKSDKEKD